MMNTTHRKSQRSNDDERRKKLKTKYLSFFGSNFEIDNDDGWLA